ncbi:MAG: hypothetical protein AAF035_11330 [Pseudomonadota bacterium]
MTKKTDRITPSFAARNGEEWTRAEDHFVLEHADFGTPLERLQEVARELGRTTVAVCTRRRELNFQISQQRDANTALLQRTNSGISAATLRDEKTPKYKTPDMTLRAIRASIERERRTHALYNAHLNRTGTTAVQHDALTVTGQEGRYVPFWERDEHAIALAQNQLSHRDHPNYPQRLARAKHAVALTSPNRMALIKAVRAMTNRAPRKEQEPQEAAL